jgi:hypothetical protein
MSTVQVSDQLLRELEKVAAKSNRSVEAVVEEALRAVVPPPPPQPSTRARVELPTYGGSGLQPGVDLDNSAALLDIMESGE